MVVVRSVDDESSRFMNSTTLMEGFCSTYRLSLMLVLVATLFLDSCATLNHGTTVPQGETAIQAAASITAIPLSLSSAFASLDYRYGVTDDFNAGVQGDLTTGGFGIGPYVMYRFRVDQLSVVPSLGISYFHAWSEPPRGDGQGEFFVSDAALPSFSLAGSWGSGPLRPYTGVQSNLVVTKIYGGMETTVDRFVYFGEVVGLVAGSHGLGVSAGVSFTP